MSASGPSVPPVLTDALQKASHLSVEETLEPSSLERKKTRCQSHICFPPKH